MSRVPLSSMHHIPMTAPTRQRLEALGLSAERLDGLSEMGAQSLLVVSDHIEHDSASAPDCHQRKYEPDTPLCDGCIFSPSCWRNDLRYLRLVNAGDADVPAGVPNEIVTERLREAAHMPIPAAPPPPKRMRKAPPPAPRRKPAPPPPPRKK